MLDFSARECALYFHVTLMTNDYDTLVAGTYLEFCLGIITKQTKNNSQKS